MDREKVDLLNLNGHSAKPLQCAGTKKVGLLNVTGAIAEKGSQEGADVVYQKAGQLKRDVRWS